MPRASVATATIEYAGFLRSARRPYRMSWSVVSTKGRPRSSRCRSFTCTAPPRRTSAARRASSPLIPRRTYSSARRSRCEATSAPKSSSSRAALKRPRMRDSRTNMRVSTRSPIGEPQHPADYAGDALPVFRFGRQLAAARFRDRVELRLPVVLRRAPGRGDPPPLLQPQERCVDRPLIELQHVVADLLDPPRDAVAVQRSHRFERLQDHQVERPLENVRLRLGHAASTPV